MHSRRRFILSLVTTPPALTLAGCAAPRERRDTAQSHDSAWTSRAATAQAWLEERYWNPRRRLYNPTYPDSTSRRALNYWWQAHALDTHIDAYERSDDPAHLHRAAALWASVKHHNRGPTNDYNDDMLWMALALLRLHDHTADPGTLAGVQLLWTDVKQGWNDRFGGGIGWRKSQPDYKNTPANAPAVILAARLHQRLADPEDLAWARRIEDWLTAHLVDPDTGFVWDGLNRQGRGRTDKSWRFTYNQGVRIGAAVELFRITGDERYLDNARRTLQATTDQLADPSGMLHEPGDADKGLFKGILIRYLAELAITDPTSRAQTHDFILRHAESLWIQIQADPQSRVPSDWTKPPTAPTDLSVHLSALMLLEQAARLDLPTSKPPR